MSRYTVSQLSRLAGVSVRTLHHYDHIGLLRPAVTGENGYRYYGTDELLRLQQILLHRELGLPLSRIARVLDAPGFDRLDTRAPSAGTCWPRRNGIGIWSPPSTAPSPYWKEKP